METRRRCVSGATAIFFRATDTRWYIRWYIYIYMRASISGTRFLQKHRPYLGSRPPNKRVEQGVTGSVEIGLACVLYPHVARVARVTRVDRDGKEIGRRAQTPFKIYPIFHRPVESWKSRAQPLPLFYFPNFRGERVGAFELARGPVPRAKILSLLCSLRITRRANIFRIKFTVEK